MDTLFLLCAVFGGVVLLAQSLLGVGEDDFDAGDGHDGYGGDGHDVGGDSHGSTWIFGVLSFRTITIGVTFFGLLGKAVSASGFEDPIPLWTAILGGLGAMYGVYFMMRGLHELNADGTQRINRSVGLEGTVYLPIPANNQGAGKVHLTLQNRSVEYLAMTAGERLPAGSQIVVIGVLGSDKVEVQPAPEIAESTHV